MLNACALEAPLYRQGKSAVSRSKWCLNSVLSAVVAVMLSGPTFSAGGEDAGSQPHLHKTTSPKLAASNAVALGAIAKTSRGTKGSIFIQMRSLDLASLQADDFGDADMSAAGH